MAIKVGIVGSYGGLNLGDEAILQVIVESFRQRFPGSQIVAFSRDADHTERHHDIDRAMPVRRLDLTTLRREVARLDALVLGGGGILFDTEASVFLRSVAVAQRSAVFTMALAIGAGPLEDRREREAVRTVVGRMDAVSVRSPWSRRILREAGVQRDMPVALDPAFLLAPEPIDGGLDSRLAALQAPLIGISVREPSRACPSLAAIPYHRYLAARAAADGVGIRSSSFHSCTCRDTGAMG